MDFHVIKQLGENADDRFPLHARDTDFVICARLAVAVALVAACDAVDIDKILAHFQTTFIPG